MKQIDFLRDIALSFPETTEEPHFEKTSFRVSKKIFVTYDAKLNRACFKFSVSDQDSFSLVNKSVIYPVPNNWGKQGWTFFELDRLEQEVLMEAVKAAFVCVVPKKLTDLLPNQVEST